MLNGIVKPNISIDEESLLRNSDDLSKELLIKLIKVIHNEMYSTEMLSLGGSIAVAATDNILYWMLNVGTANTIAKWFSLSNIKRSILKYALLTNGVVSISAMDLFASRGIIRKIVALANSLQILPDYAKWFISVITVSILTSVLAASGPAAVIYKNYDENKFLAVFFSVATVVVNAFYGMFFVQSQLDLIKSQIAKRTTEEKNYLDKIKYWLGNLASNTQTLEDEKFTSLANSLKSFNLKKAPSDEDIYEIVNLLKPLFRANKELPSIDNTEKSASNILMHIPSLFNMVIGGYFGYCVGNGAINEFDNNSDSTLSHVMGAATGSCLAALIGITAFYSTAGLLTKIKGAGEKYLNKYYNAESLTREDYMAIGKSLVVTVVSFLTSLSYVELVDEYVKTESKSTKLFMYVAVTFQDFFVNAYSLQELSPIEFMKRLYVEVGQFFVKKVDVEKRRLGNNLNSLVEQLEIASGKDIRKIYETFMSSGLLEDSKEENDLTTLSYQHTSV
jgi:hypothetical protein